MLASKMAKNAEEEKALEKCKPVFYDLRENAQGKVERYRLELIGDLTSLGEEAGLDMTIDFPRFSILKGIDGEIAFGDRTTTINNKVMKSIDPRRIVTALGRLKKELYDRPFEPEKYVDSLHKIYDEICKADNLPASAPVPIQRFHLLQLCQGFIPYLLLLMSFLCGYRAKIMNAFISGKNRNPPILKRIMVSPGNI